MEPIFDISKENIIRIVNDLSKIVMNEICRDTDNESRASFEVRGMEFKGMDPSGSLGYVSDRIDKYLNIVDFFDDEKKPEHIRDIIKSAYRIHYVDEQCASLQFIIGFVKRGYLKSNPVFKVQFPALFLDSEKIVYILAEDIKQFDTDEDEKGLIKAVYNILYYMLYQFTELDSFENSTSIIKFSPYEIKRKRRIIIHIGKISRIFALLILGYDESYADIISIESKDQKIIANIIKAGYLQVRFGKVQFKLRVTSGNHEIDQFGYGDIFQLIFDSDTV